MNSQKLKTKITVPFVIFMFTSISCLFPLNLKPTQNINLLEPGTLSPNNPKVQNLDSAISQIENGDKIKPKKQSRLRKALFGATINQKTQIRKIVNIIFQYLIMTLALCICLFGIRILYYLPLFLFFFRRRWNWFRDINNKDSKDNKRNTKKQK